MKPAYELITKAGERYPLAGAESAGERRRGLLDHDRAPDYGLWLRRCPLIHMLGMSFPLDIVFSDRRGRIRKVYSDVRPGLRLRGSLRGWSCIELPAGIAAELQIAAGERIEIRPLRGTGARQASGTGRAEGDRQ